ENSSIYHHNGVECIITMPSVRILPDRQQHAPDLREYLDGHPDSIFMLVFGRCFHYMRGSIAPCAMQFRPPLDDIPAVGVPFLHKERKITMSITAERKQELLKEFATAKG